MAQGLVTISCMHIMCVLLAACTDMFIMPDACGHSQHLALRRYWCSPAQSPGVLRLRNSLGLLGAAVFAAGVSAAGVLGGLPGPCTCSMLSIFQTKSTNRMHANFGSQAFLLLLRAST